MGMRVVVVWGLIAGGALAGCEPQAATNGFNAAASSCRFTILRAENPRLVTVGRDEEPLPCGNRQCFTGGHRWMVRALPGEGERQGFEVTHRGAVTARFAGDGRWLDNALGVVGGTNHVMWSDGLEVFVLPAMVATPAPESLGLFMPPPDGLHAAWMWRTPEGVHLVQEWPRGAGDVPLSGQPAKNLYMTPMQGHWPTRIDVYNENWMLIEQRPAAAVHQVLRATAPWPADESPAIIYGARGGTGRTYYSIPYWPSAEVDDETGEVFWHGLDCEHMTHAGRVHTDRRAGLRLTNGDDVRVWEPDDGHDFLGAPLPAGWTRRRFKFSVRLAGQVLVVERLRSDTCRIEDRVYLYDANMDGAELVAAGPGMRLHPRYADGAWRFVEADVNYVLPGG